MLFSLVTLTGLKFREDIYEVVLPTPSGEIAILPHHMPLVTLVSPGEVRVRWRERDSDDKMDSFAVSGGIAEMIDNELRLLSDEADKPDEIVAEQAQAALDKAQKMKDAAKSRLEIEQAQELIDRSKVRLELAKSKRRKRNNV